jgi:hypothetical protein
MVLLFVIAMAAVALITTVRAGPLLDGNNLKLEAFRFDGQTYITLKKTAENNEAYTGPVNLIISNAGESSEPLTVFFSLQTTEAFGFTLPYEANELTLTVQSGDESLDITLKPN